MSEIRRATHDDYEAVCELLRVLDEHHSRSIPEVFTPFDGPARTRESVEEIVASDEEDFLLADVGGIVVGLAQVKVAEMPRAPMFRRARYALLENLVVAETHRRSGVGTQLLEEAKSWARARGLARLQTIVWTENAEAVGFYERAGFRPVTVRLALDLD